MNEEEYLENQDFVKFVVMLSILIFGFVLITLILIIGLIILLV